jgi:aquaporin Z
MVFQFLGGIAGVWLSALVLRSRIAVPQVDYAVTIPGVGGSLAAFAAEMFMAALMMTIVLWTSSRPKLARYTTWIVSLLIANYIVFSRR